MSNSSYKPCVDAKAHSAIIAAWTFFITGKKIIPTMPMLFIGLFEKRDT